MDLSMDALLRGRLQGALQGIRLKGMQLDAYLVGSQSGCKAYKVSFRHVRSEEVSKLYHC